MLRAARKSDLLSIDCCESLIKANPVLRALVADTRYARTVPEHSRQSCSDFSMLRSIHSQ
jgi:hypothetical protein